MRKPMFFLALATLAACGGPKPVVDEVAPTRSLGGLTAQRMVVLPSFALNVAPELGWRDDMGSSRDILRQLDTDILTVLEDRGLRERWVFPEQLVRSHRNNPTYTADPYALGEEPLRSPTLRAGDRLPEPLASEVRTMVALNDARYLVAPVELKLSQAGIDSGVPSLRVVVLDARFSEVRWVGEVKGEPITAFNPTVLGVIASRFADLFVER